jgi:hypothetical protein
MTILANGRAITAAVMATNSTDQSRPFLDHRRTRVAVLMANDPEAVVLQLVNPSVARWHRRGEHG